MLPTLKRPLDDNVSGRCYLVTEPFLRSSCFDVLHLYVYSNQLIWVGFCRNYCLWNVFRAVYVHRYLKKVMLNKYLLHKYLLINTRHWVIFPTLFLFCFLILFLCISVLFILRYLLFYLPLLFYLYSTLKFSASIFLCFVMQFFGPLSVCFFFHCSNLFGSL